MSDLTAARVADGDYMSVWEFSKLPSDVQHAVWAARDIDWIPATRSNSSIRCYRREQVEAIMRGLAVTA